MVRRREPRDGVTKVFERHTRQAPKWARTIGATSAIDHDPWSWGASTPQKASAPSESTRCSEPWLPPPTWSTPPQSANS